SERWLQQRPDQIKTMIAVAYKGMAHARAQRQDSISLIALKWKMERDVAEKAFDMMVKTWADTGVASDQSLREGIEESLRVTKAQQAVPISQVADFTLAREVYREMKTK
ncbi:MAG: hypothetical protein ABW172_08710, partial [Candidatus Binatia bacterium]